MKRLKSCFDLEQSLDESFRASCKKIKDHHIPWPEDFEKGKKILPNVLMPLSHNFKEDHPYYKPEFSLWTAAGKFNEADFFKAEIGDSFLIWRVETDNGEFADNKNSSVMRLSKKTLELPSFLKEFINPSRCKSFCVWMPTSLIPQNHLKLMESYFKTVDNFLKKDENYSFLLNRLGMFLRCFGNNELFQFTTLLPHQNFDVNEDVIYDPEWKEDLENAFGHFKLGSALSHYGKTSSSIYTNVKTRQQHNVFLYYMFCVFGKEINTSTLNFFLPNKQSISFQNQWDTFLYVMVGEAVRKLPPFTTLLKILDVEQLEDFAENKKITCLSLLEHEKKTVVGFANSLVCFFKGLQIFIRSECRTPSNQAKILAHINQIFFNYFRIERPMFFTDWEVSRKVSCRNAKPVLAYFIHNIVQAIHTCVPLQFYNDVKIRSARSLNVLKCIKSDEAFKNNLLDGTLICNKAIFLSFISGLRSKAENVVETKEEACEVGKLASNEIAQTFIFFQASSGMRMNEIFDTQCVLIPSLDEGKLCVVGVGKCNDVGIKKKEKYNMLCNLARSYALKVDNNLVKHMHKLVEDLKLCIDSEHLKTCERFLLYDCKLHDILRFKYVILPEYLEVKKMKFNTLKTYVNTYLNNSNVKLRKYNKQGEYVGIVKLSSHDLRGIYATFSYEVFGKKQLMLVAYVQEIFNHTNVSTSLRYCKKFLK